MIGNLSDYDRICLAWSISMVLEAPSYATLNVFVNHVLGPMAEAIGDELAAAVLRTMHGPLCL